MKKIFYAFARNKLRKQIEFKPEFKDLTRAYQYQKQISELRDRFTQDISGKQIFSQVLQNPNTPKLGTRFKVSTKLLNKKIKKVYNKKLQNMTFEGRGDEQFLRQQLLSKSDLYNQDAEIEAQQKFKKELFVKKETKRLLNKQENNPKRILDENHEFEYYEKAKNTIKNIRIHNILKDNQNNKQLQLLIQSGLMDNTQNLKKMIQKLNQMKVAKQQNLLIQSATDHKHQKIVQNLDLNIENQMVITKDFQKLTEFVTLYQQSRLEDQEKTKKTIDLLKEVKQYQQKSFLKRYDAINFRYKGRVDFDFFKQKQLLSYIKHTNIQPKDLMLIFQQNLNRMNREKDNLILTPTVLAQIYTKTSLYKYPETQLNNKINMLSDKPFIKLQRFAFENIDKIPDEGFTDLIFAFSKNHFEEQGSLKPKMFEKILEVIVQQFQQRIDYLPQEYLGFVCRSLCKLPIFSKLENNSAILQKIQDRITEINGLYALELICQFVSMIPCQKSKSILLKALPKFNQSEEWTEDTIITVCKTYSFILNKKNTSIEEYNSLKNLIQLKKQKISSNIQKIKINDLKFLATVLIKLQIYDVQIFNKIKYHMVQTIKKQTQKFHPNTIPYLLTSLSFFDYFRMYKNHNIELHNCVQSFFSRTVIKFNSIKFFPYHEITFLFDTEYNKFKLPNKLLILRNLSFVGYKSQGFYDNAIQRILTQSQNQKKLNVLLQIVAIFHYQKRKTPLTQLVIKYIFDMKFEFHGRIQTLIQFIIGMSNLMQQCSTQITQKLESIYLQHIFPFKSELSHQQITGLIGAFVILQSKNIKLLSDLLNLIDQKLLDKIRLQQKLLLAMSNLLLKNQLIRDLPLNFNELESKYQSSIIDQFKQSEIRIGTNLPINKVSDQLFAILKKQENVTIKKLPWRYEVSSEKQKTLYMIFTYEMFFTHENQKGDRTFKTFGIWKLYELLYKNLGFEIDVIKSFHWKNMP